MCFSFPKLGIKCLLSLSKGGIKIHQEIPLGCAIARKLAQKAL